MIDKKLFVVDGVPDNLLARLDTRDIALWVRDLPHEAVSRQALLAFMGLPWRLVVTESVDAALVGGLEATPSLQEPLTRKRGFVQVIDGDPSRIELPQRSLPVYLLNGRHGAERLSDFDGRLRRMTMLEQLRRSGAREILVVAADDSPVPPDLIDLWSSGFRAYLTFISGSPAAEPDLEQWLLGIEGGVGANLLRLPAAAAIDDILARYMATYPDERHVVRVRDGVGHVHKVDVTDADEPERPILDRFSLIEERSLAPLVAEELSEEDFVAFFQNPTSSWRPYAAGLPWIRDPQCFQDLRRLLRRLDVAGAAENCIAYISSESGAGGTTLARALAWRIAQDGYPVLVAKPVPFVPDALPIVNFLIRALEHVRSQTQSRPESSDSSSANTLQPLGETGSHRYEAPWLIVFDSLHWEGRDSELVRFRNELEKSGRPVCILVVTGTTRGLSFYNKRIFHVLAELNHAIDMRAAHQLGAHLNQFLRIYGKERQEWQWERFHADHMVRYLDGQAAFWVTLSFWIQGQFDLSESIQEWMYRALKTNVTDPTMRTALLEIAALSSERLPMPEGLLPSSSSKWPVAQLLEDSVATLGPLGLVRVSEDGQKYWALVHDILGRLLVNALFYDFPVREELGFAGAVDAEHLRFLLLRQISQKALLGEKQFRSLGDDFATSIFKLDPDHGHGAFVSNWRDVLSALDDMPRPLRDTSRVFRHHTAVSRRRVAKLSQAFYGVTDADRYELLNRAIDDITYALGFIEYSPGSEPNLNLWNSLANAYFDLSELELTHNAPNQRIEDLRRLASEATRRAYDESPTNSFVIETYVKNLLQNARYLPNQAIEQCVEALGIVFSAITANESANRSSQLGELADQALRILFAHIPEGPPVEPKRAIDVLLNAWKALVEGRPSLSEVDLEDLPEPNQQHALDILSHPAGRGNMQVLRMRYDLLAMVEPFAFKEQLEYVEQLQATDYRMTPQLRLEYAILLFQNSRASEGDKAFRRLRELWRDSEHFVQIPERLRWLIAADGDGARTVQAVTGSDYGNRAMARVREFNNALVPFRPEEHGFRDLRPGMQFACHVSFGHNGPFLRPMTAQPAHLSRGSSG